MDDNKNTLLVGSNENMSLIWSDENAITPPKNTDITFQIDDQVVLKLTKDGFIYQGETIKDAGKAYDIFVQTMEKLGNI